MFRRKPRPEAVLHFRSDPLWIAELERRKRKAERVAVMKSVAVAVADGAAAGVASVAMFAVIALMIVVIGGGA